MINENELQKNEKITIRKIKRTDVDSLLAAGFHFGKNKINYPLISRIRQYTGLSLKQKGFVAYNVDDKSAAGFLSLTEHTSSLQSIRYVFINPAFRRRGIATELVTFAISFAKKRGVKKIFLTSSPSGGATELYKKIGFRQIVNSTEVWGGGKTPKISNEVIGNLIPLDSRLKTDQNLLFKIYKHRMGKNWINFFENNARNLFYGYSQEFKSFFYRSAYVNKQNDSVVIMFKRPMSHLVNAELYVANDSQIKALFREVMKLFKQKGIIYSKITVFNVNNNDCSDLLKRNNFYPYTTIFMGKLLNKH